MFSPFLKCIVCVLPVQIFSALATGEKDKGKKRQLPLLLLGGTNSHSSCLLKPAPIAGSWKELLKDLGFKMNRLQVSMKSGRGYGSMCIKIG